MNQRARIGYYTFCLMAGIFAGKLAGQDAPLTTPLSDEQAILQKLTEKSSLDLTIENGIRYLLSQQQPNGSFGTVYPCALTGLSVMALLSVGHTPQSTEYGEPIKRALHFVLSQMRADGYLGHRDNSRMYGHGICTLMLTEAIGLTHDPLLERRLAEACERAVRLILAAQAVPKKNPLFQGGWRYEPDSDNSDLSLTGWQTMSLRAAKNIGLEVPASAIDDAVAFIRRMAAPKGGFGYQVPEDKPALRGVGLLALPVCGIYEAPELEATSALMERDPIEWKGPFFYYRIYYAATGMYRMGDRAWLAFWPQLQTLLLEKQQPDGSWPEPPGNNEAIGPVYNTAMTLLALTVTYQLLPIYQR